MGLSSITTAVICDPDKFQNSDNFKMSVRAIKLLLSPESFLHCFFSHIQGPKKQHLLYHKQQWIVQ